MSSNFNKYLRNVGLVAMTALTLVGAGCSGNAPVASEPVNPGIAVGEQNPSTPSTPSEDTTPAASASVYKDGTYSADGKYVSPGGAETIGITLTLKDDVITDASAVTHPSNPNTKFFQERFASGFKAMIVGKKISDVELKVVSGSSLTPKGFADAVTQIEAEAKA